MRSRELQGKTVKRVVQARWESNAGRVWALEAIEFTDGSVLRFTVVEGEGDYGIEPIYPARGIA